MSILINGMEMPTSCARCPMLEGDRFDGMCHAASKWLDDDEFWEWFVYPEGDVDESKPCNCPLVEVPPYVSCENCKYCRKVDESEYWCYGFCSPARLVRKDDFCSYGCKNK